MNVVLPPIVLLPFVLALLPAAAAPSAISPRRLTACTVLAATITIGLAVWSASSLPGEAWLNGSPGVWRNDPLGRTAPLLPALSWLLTALRGSEPGEAMRTASGRRWPVAAQLATATAMALCRADMLALVPVLMGGLLLWSGQSDDGRDRSLWLGAVPVMAIGVAILSAVSGMPARWSVLAARLAAGQPVPTPSRLGLILVLAPLLLVLVALLVRPALLARTTPLRGLSRLLVLPPALCVAVRADAVAPLEPVLLPVGIGAILVALLLVPSCRTLVQRISLVAALQAGASMVAIAAGGPGGIAAAAMLTGFGALLLPVAAWVPVDAGAARLRAIAVLALVGMPPFGPFAAALVLLVRLWGTQPLLALFMLAACTLSALSVLDAFGREPAGAAGFRVTPWVACVAIVLVVAGWLGVAMPTAYSDWLLLIGEARS